MTSRFCAVLITTPPGKPAKLIAEQILSKRFAACVNILPTVESTYWWKGKRESAKECLLIVKTTRKNLKALISFVREIHPYSVPEIIALPIQAGNPEYLHWIEIESRGRR